MRRRSDNDPVPQRFRHYSPDDWPGENDAAKVSAWAAALTEWSERHPDHDVIDLWASMPDVPWPNQGSVDWGTGG